MAKQTVTSAEVERIPSEPVETDWSQVVDFASAEAMFAEVGVHVEDVTQYGDGFLVMPTDDKAKLVGVPFIVLDGTFRVDKNTDREYVSLRILTSSNEKWIVNDGSVGVYAQCRDIVKRRKSGSLAGLVVKNGLTGGEYTTTLPSGEKVTASTFYFAGV